MPSNDKRMTGLRLAFAAFAGLAAIASLFITGDGMLRMQFDTAFHTGNVVPMVRHQAPVAQPVAATEDYWLGDVRRSGATQAAWNQDGHIDIGDRISLTMKGVKRILEVVAVEAGPAGLLASTGNGPSVGKAPVLVTLRDIGNNGRPIQLLLEGDQDLQGFVRVSERPHEL